MYQKCVGVLAGLGLAATAAQGATITVANTDITVSGGAAGGFYYSTHSGDVQNLGPNTVPDGADHNDDNFLISDYLLQLSHDVKTAGDIGFTAAIGNLQEISVIDGGGSRSYNDPDYGVQLQYGWLSYMPVNGLTFQVGKLATNVGSEVPPSYSNPNITLGALWSTQPTYYDGIRATYALGTANVYVEADRDTSGIDDVRGNPASADAIGLNGTMGTVNYSISYFNYLDAGSKCNAVVNNACVGSGPRPDNYLDVVVGDTFAGWSTGLNFDYDTLDDDVKTAHVDDSAYGAAVYVTPPKYGKWTLPIRFEYLHDGSSGIFYDISHGYTITATPTYHVTDNTFVRAEASYVQTGNPVYLDSNGNPAKEKFSVALQAGVTF